MYLARGIRFIDTNRCCKALNNLNKLIYSSDVAKRYGYDFNGCNNVRDILYNTDIKILVIDCT